VGTNNDKLLFAFVDDLLDHQSPVAAILPMNRQAEIVQNAFPATLPATVHVAGVRGSCPLAVLPDENWSRKAVERSRQSG